MSNAKIPASFDKVETFVREPVDLPFIDGHHHFLDLSCHSYPWLDGGIAKTRYGDFSDLCRDYSPEDYFLDTKNQNVVGLVHVEAEVSRDDPVSETRRLHGVADRFGFPNAIVGHARFARDDVDQVLRQHASYPLVRGIREKPVTANSAAMVVKGTPGSMSDPKWRAGFALLGELDLTYDVQIPYWHLTEAADLARAFPDTTIILNHTGLPADRSDRGLAAWREAMAAFANQPNTAVKISGLGVRGQAWTMNGNRKIVLEAIALFGVDRCMFTSNFPVDKAVADYDTIVNGFKEIVKELEPAAKKKLFHDNAARFYRLNV